MDVPGSDSFEIFLNSHFIVDFLSNCVISEFAFFGLLVFDIFGFQVFRFFKHYSIDCLSLVLDKFVFDKFFILALKHALANISDFVFIGISVDFE